MKKLTSLFVILALLMLCACGSKTGSTADGAAAPDSSDIPEVCRVYEDYVLMEAIAPQNSRLPLASGAARGTPDYVPLWHEGEYSQLAAHGGEGWRMDELTDGKATEGGDYGRFCWDGQLYHCIHVQAADSYIPNLTSDCGGILWLELTGSCWGDDGTTEGGYFTGFDTVILTGSGTLELKQNLDCGRGERPFPALILDGPEVTCPSASLVPNTAADTTANLVLLSGRLRTEALIIGGDVCITGGSLSVNMLIDCLRLVCRGGETILTEGWGNAEEWASKVPAVLLTGGTLTADLWLDERTVYYLWAGSITGPGLAHLPGVHLLGENVTVRDTLES